MLGCRVRSGRPKWKVFTSQEVECIAEHRCMSMNVYLPDVDITSALVPNSMNSWSLILPIVITS